jgi:hypothetical protein
MRWLPVLGALVLAAGCSGSSKSTNTTNSTTTPTSTPPTTQGNLRVSAKAPEVGTGADRRFYRNVIVSVQDPKSGSPVPNAAVSVYGEMISPHSMILITKDLREVSRGKYERPYTFIMNGEWTVHIVVRSKKGVATSDLPVKVGG